ncbi:MAG: hypothetical protein V3V30_03250 [Parvularculaceae bacterium]
MTSMTDTLFIKAGVDAVELRQMKGRTALYIGTLMLVGMSLSFAALAIGNVIA